MVHKTGNKFTSMTLSQCHEQNNAMVKGCGGVIRLTGNQGALRHGPQIERFTAEFEQAIKKQDGASHLHHDQHPGVQVKDVKVLVAVLEELGTPLLK